VAPRSVLPPFGEIRTLGPPFRYPSLLADSEARARERLYSSTLHASLPSASTVPATRVGGRVEFPGSRDAACVHACMLAVAFRTTGRAMWLRAPRELDPSPPSALPPAGTDRGAEDLRLRGTAMAGRCRPWHQRAGRRRAAAARNTSRWPPRRAAATSGTIAPTTGGHQRPGRSQCPALSSTGSTPISLTFVPST